jgi:hypothetical protein
MILPWLIFLWGSLKERNIHRAEPAEKRLQTNPKHQGRLQESRLLSLDPEGVMMNPNVLATIILYIHP